MNPDSKTITIDNIIIMIMNIVSEEVADKGAVVLAVSLSVTLEMSDPALYRLIVGTDAGFSVIRASLGAAVWLQSTLFRTSQLKFSSIEGLLHFKFRSPTAFSETLSNKPFISQSQFHGLLSAFSFRTDDGASLTKHDSELSLGR
jgi:hypothetical protein